MSSTDFLPFAKLSGTGNDFILIDNRHGLVAPGDMAALAKAVCRRRIAIGADGLIFIEDDPEYHFKWRFFNADGSEPAMCGNGSRCAARFAHVTGIAPEEMVFRTLAGPIQAGVTGKRVKVRLTPPRDLRLGREIVFESGSVVVDTVDTGVPHAILFVDELETADVDGLGPLVRYHSDFGSEGTNVDFVTITSPQTLAMRTYERGVEGETLACGTGAVASALVAAAKELAAPPISVATRSGETLVISFSSGENLPREVELEGEVRWVADGRVSPEAWADMLAAKEEKNG